MALNSINQTISAIKNNKFKVFLIFFIQTLFFISLTLISYKTIVPATEEAKTAMDYYDTINITEDSGMFGYLGDNPATVFDSYKNIAKYLKILGIASILSFIILNGLIWALADNLTDKKNLKEFLIYLLNFTIIAAVSILAFYAFIFQSLKSALIQLPAALPQLSLLLTITLILLYLMFTAIAMIKKRDIKEIAKLTFKISIKKFHKIIPACIINILIMSLFFYLISITIEANMIILSIVIILFVFSFVVMKIFLIETVNNLAK